MAREIFFFSRNLGIFDCVSASSRDAATKTTPSAEYRGANLLSIGISSRHGPHHVAQKFKTTILPRNSASDTGLPVRSVSVRSSADVPAFGAFCATWARAGERVARMQSSDAAANGMDARQRRAVFGRKMSASLKTGERARQ